MPEFEIHTACPVCKREAVRMVIDKGRDENAVYWCEGGHVTVHTEEFGDKKVFDFQEM
jgi:hypothetical protein